MHPVHASLDLIIQFLYFHTVHSLWHDLVWGTNAAKITANVWDKVEFDAQQVESDLLSEYFMSFKEKLPPGQKAFLVKFEEQRLVSCEFCTHKYPRT